MALKAKAVASLQIDFDLTDKPIVARVGDLLYAIDTQNSYICTEAGPPAVWLLVAGIERGKLTPSPSTPVDSQGQRVAQTTLEGAIFNVLRDTEFNQINWRATARNGSPTIRFLFYQAVDGKQSGPFFLVAQATGIAVPATGNYVTPLDGGAVARLSVGATYLLWGRDSAAGSATVRTYGYVDIDLLTSNVPATISPCVFQTSLPSTGVPDPTISPLTFAASSLNLGPVTVLTKV